ncbi:hypothetical protein LCGC14_2979580, partial [marine sediment metagenome]
PRRTGPAAAARTSQAARSTVPAPARFPNTASGCSPPAAAGFAVFEELVGMGQEEGHSVAAVHRVAVYDVLDGFKIEKVCIISETGLQIVKDPTTTPVMIAMILIGLGISLTFIQKLGDKNL